MKHSLHKASNVSSTSECDCLHQIISVFVGIMRVYDRYDVLMTIEHDSLVQVK